MRKPIMPAPANTGAPKPLPLAAFSDLTSTPMDPVRVLFLVIKGNGSVPQEGDWILLLEYLQGIPLLHDPVDFLQGVVFPGWSQTLSVAKLDVAATKAAASKAHQIALPAFGERSTTVFKAPGQRGGPNMVRSTASTPRDVNRKWAKWVKCHP